MHAASLTSSVKMYTGSKKSYDENNRLKHQSFVHAVAQLGCHKLSL